MSGQNGEPCSLDSLTATLRNAGFRVTPQRLEVAREVAQSREHPDVETIYRGVRTRMPTISLDTVYRTLSALEELGLIKRLTGIGGPVRYDGNSSPHHHFICESCGSIQDIDAETLDLIPIPEQASHLGQINRVEVQLHGLCSKCLQQEPRLAQTQRDIVTVQSNVE